MLVLLAGVPPAKQEPTAAPAPRVRPRYDEVQQTTDQAVLAEWVEEWRATSHGLEEPIDPGVVLASSTALSNLSSQREHAKELLELLGGVAEQLDGADSDPDLALAFAQGWAALSSPECAVDIAPEDRIEGLDLAVEVAEAIDVADGRDAYGCAIAAQLYALLQHAEPDEAASVLEEAVERFPSDTPGRVWMLATLADQHRIRSSWDSAWRYREEARRTAARAGSLDARLRAFVAAVGCNLELACGQFDLAAASLEEEREAAKQAEDSNANYSLLIDAAGVAMATVEPKSMAAALQGLERALADDVYATDRTRLAELRARRAILTSLQEERQATGDGNADALLEAAFGDDALDAVTRATLGLKRVESALRAGDDEGAVSWITKIEKHAPTEQEELGHALTAYRALSALRGSDDEVLRKRFADVSNAYEELLSDIGDSPMRQGGFGWLSWRHRRAVVAAMVELALALDPEGGAEQALGIAMREDATGSLARRLGFMDAKKERSSADARLLVRPEVGLLAYVPSFDSVHLLFMHAEGVRAYRIPWKYELETAPTRMQELLSGSPYELEEKMRSAKLQELQELGSELGGRLVPDELREELSKLEGFYVAGNELLGNARFECFRLDDRWLGQEKGIGYLPSLAVGVDLAKRNADAGKRAASLLLLTAPALPEGVLPGLARFELDSAQLARLKAGFERVEVLTGKEASGAGLLEALRNRPTVLHLLVHGHADPLRELSGGLVLAGEDEEECLLRCEELAKDPFHGPPIVLLSACESARGPRRVGDDGMAQLGGVFFEKGTRCVVESTSDLALEPTLELTGVFQREVARGRPPALAMRAARRALLESKSRFAHPFYALSLRVVGLGFEPAVDAARAQKKK